MFVAIVLSIVRDSSARLEKRIGIKDCDKLCSIFKGTIFKYLKKLHLRNSKVSISLKRIILKKKGFSSRNEFRPIFEIFYEKGIIWFKKLED